MSVSFHVFFENPFWAGLFSITEGDTVRYCRVVFGQEPADIELYKFVLNNFNSLTFSEINQPVPENVLAVNPKKRQKQVAKELKQNTGTRQSYRAIKESIKAGKKTIRKKARQRRLTDDKKLAFEVNQRKKKEKRRGH